MSLTEGRYLVGLRAMCKHKDEKKILGPVPFLFKTQKNFDIAWDDMFDSLHEHFNIWLSEHGEKGWTTEYFETVHSEISEAIDPIIIEEY
jgi:hypothetical protein